MMTPMRLCNLIRVVSRVTQMALVSTFFLVSSSCVSKKGYFVGNDPSAKIVHINLKTDISKTISISDICSRVELVQLDNSQEALTDMTKIVSVVYAEDKIYVLEKEGRVLVFGYDGELIDVFNRGGRGAGEFNLGTCMAMNEQIRTLEILSAFGGIYKYDAKNCDFVGLDEGVSSHLRAVHSFFPINENEYLLYSSSNEEGQAFYFNSSDNEFKFLGCQIPAWLSGTAFSVTGHPYYRVGQDIHFVQKFNGSIYRFDPKEIKLLPYISLDLGENQITEETLDPDKDVFYYERIFNSVSRKRATSFNFVSESESKLYEAFLYKGRINYHTLVYDKTTGEHIVFNKTTEGVHFIPDYIRGDKMFHITNPEWISLEINDKVPMDEESRRVFDNITEESNVVLIKYTLK